MNLDATPTIVAEMNAEIAGALAYRLVDAGFTLSRWRPIQCGSAPAWRLSRRRSELLARRLGIPRGRVDDNDNLPSLYFYQRRGYFCLMDPEWCSEAGHGTSPSAWGHSYSGRSTVGEND